MRRVVLFIAMSLDGYIADAQGGVGWLGGQGGPEETPDTYSEFVQGVDTVVMGWRTYHQIVTELSPSQWVYAGLDSYVITHHTPPSRKAVTFTDRDSCALVEELRELPGKDIWICGGAELVRQLLDAGVIDTFHISIIPTLLGSGVRLFGAIPEEIKLKLTVSRTYDGIVELVYTRR